MVDGRRGSGQQVVQGGPQIFQPHPGRGVGVDHWRTLQKRVRYPFLDL